MKAFACVLCVLSLAVGCGSGSGTSATTGGSGGHASGGNASGGKSGTGGAAGSGGSVRDAAAGGSGADAASTGGVGTSGGSPANGGAGGAGGDTKGDGAVAAGSGGRGGNGGSSDGRGGNGGGSDGSAGSAGSCGVSVAGQTVTSLAGTWTFTPSGASATTIDVPGGGWLAQGFNTNSARYERTVTVPDLGRPQATYIEFGVVNHQAILAVDGTTVATNTTSFTPSVFDVTAAVKPGGSHKVAVDVKGRDALKSSSGKKLVPDAAGWSSNVPQGIFRSAVVRAVPVLHVLDAFVRTDVASDKISVDVWVKNAGTSAANGTVDVALSSWTCDSFNYPSLPSVPVASVAAGKTVKVTVGPVAWGLGATSYWWPNVPYAKDYRAKLHIARVTVTPDDAGGGAAAAHSVPVRFGFRQIVQKAAHYELNGVRVNFRGDNIQGANYDSINTGKGPSDAYDLLPGFLPPSGSSPGWPQAVDNYLRLNYNVNRVHQEPASPYMLDVADELGLMIIDETAIRGSNGDQDYVEGLDNMLAHVDALVRRDRNHPAVIRWSQCNEAEFDTTNSTAFQKKLYDAVMAADDTRPVSADSGLSGANAYSSYGITESNFTVLEHYPGGTGTYTESVTTSTSHPFGVGEYIWPKDQTAQGLMWFATSTLAMRQKDASDLRPYTLLSGWASFVPGIRTTMMKLEPTYPEGVVGQPLYGEDNLSDPWSNPILVRIQRGMNPVAVADVAYWNANRMSDSSGKWPTSSESVTKGAKLSRQLVVFNDTFSGTAVDVSWEMHADTAAGAISDQGTSHLDIPLGSRTTTSISVTAPATGTNAVLILQASKGGSVVFRDDAQTFKLQ